MTHLDDIDQQFIADQSNLESKTEDVITSDYPDYTDLEQPFLDPNLYKVPKNEAMDAFMELGWWFETPVIEVDR